VKLPFAHRCSWLKGEPPGTRTQQLAAKDPKAIYDNWDFGFHWRKYTLRGAVRRRWQWLEGWWEDRLCQYAITGRRISLRGQTLFFGTFLGQFRLFCRLSRICLKSSFYFGAFCACFWVGNPLQETTFYRKLFLMLFELLLSCDSWLKSIFQWFEPFELLSRPTIILSRKAWSAEIKVNASDWTDVL